MYSLYKTYYPSVTDLLRLSDAVGLDANKNLSRLINVVGLVANKNLPRLKDAAGFSSLLKTFSSFFARFDKKGMKFAERERERESFWFQV